MKFRIDLYLTDKKEYQDLQAVKVSYLKNKNQFIQRFTFSELA